MSPEQVGRSSGDHVASGEAPALLDVSGDDPVAPDDVAERVERMLLGRPASMGRREVTEGAGVGALTARRFWHAMGFQNVTDDEAMFTEADTQALRRVAQIIDEGRLGRLYHFRGTYLQDWVADPNVPLYWRLQKEKAGSGALGDIASHSLDLAHYLVGPVTEVSAALETFVKERPLPDNPKKKGRVTVDDASASIVRFENGALGTIEASRFATGRKNYNRFEINGSKGSIAFNLERMNELDVYFTDDEKRVQGFHNIMVTEPEHPYFKAWWPAGHIIGYEHTFVHTVYDLLESIAKNKMPTPNFEDGVKNQKVLAAMEKAAATRRWVAVK